MAFNPYATDFTPEEKNSDTLQRYAWMKMAAQQAAQGGANPSAAAGGPYNAIEPDVSPAPLPAPAAASPQSGPSQRGDIIRGPDGKLRLVKQPAGA